MRATSEPVRPHAIQEEALAALRRSRANGHRAGLVVLATGLGKTWLAAFDAAAAAQEAGQTIEQQRLLFVAHRAEILDQARETFARVRPRARLGTFTGVEKEPDATVLFGSIQTLARHEHLRQFAPTAFDYIVIDEFHHAAADTYRRILEHFTPRFLLGLTATPERTDGGDLLALCGHNLVHRTDLAEGVRRGFLAPFDYHGVPDDVDYGAIPWSRSKGFEAMPLERAVATRVRAQNALDQWQRHRGTRGLGFCVSVGHADFMGAFFREHGIAAASVHSGPTSAPREQTLADLTAGSLEILFCVDMFNEGVDIPAIDTVLMLRPTESRIIWLQQFGRGLRRLPDKVLRVIDYIGNHQSFATKVQAMMSSLLGAGEGRHELRTHLHELQRGTEDLPPGCNVTYDVRIVPLLESLLAPVGNEDELRLAYQQFRDEHGRRPTAREMYLNGSLRAHVLRAVHGSWFGLVHAMGDLDAQQQELLGRHRGFLLALETVPVRTCHTMVALTAMLEAGALPGRITVEALVERVDQLADRFPLVQLQLEMDRTTPGALESCLRQAIERTFGLGARTQAAGHCTLTATDFGTVFDTALPADREAFAALVRELVDWRLAEHLGRFERVAILGRIACDARGTTTVVFEVEAGLELPEPTFQVHLGAPDPSVPRLSAHIAELRANTLLRLRDPQRRTDCLEDQLDAWFPGRAGAEGRADCVVLTVEHGRFWMQPQPRPDPQRLLLGSSYSREAIAPLFGCTFNRGNWLGGVVRVPDGLVLFVSLEKDTLAEVHRYEDRFLSRGEFEWQSQNVTKQDSARGRSYRDHMGNGESVHLFVRKSRKTRDGRGEPFWYCGELEFLRWEGERPITVWWRLKVPLGEELARRFLG